MNGKEYTSEDGIVIALPTFEQVLGFSNFYDAETYDRISPYYRNAIKNINILPIKSDPTSGDGDNDGALDICDYKALSYNINDEFCFYFSKLEELTEKYFTIHNIPNKSFKSNNKVLYMFSFIKHFKKNDNGESLYCIGHWISASGNIEKECYDYIFENSNETYHYFESNGEEMRINDTKSTNFIDLYHMAATITTLTYKTDMTDVGNIGDRFSDSDEYFKEFFKYVFDICADQFTSEKYIDALSGWGGDLQQLMVDAKIYWYRNGKDENSFNFYLDEHLGKDDMESRMGYSDIVSDIDAVMLYNEQLKNSNYITSSFRKYYNNIDNSFDRFKTFKDKYFEAKLVRKITNTYYPFNINMPLDAFVTPVFRQNYNYYEVIDGERVYFEMDIYFSDEQSDYASQCFLDFIYNMISNN